jgi:hypothetical protein
MENNNNTETSSKCCDHAHCGHMHKFFWLRWLLGLGIIFITLYIGIKIGEFKGTFENGFDGYMMGNHRSYMMPRGYFNYNNNSSGLNQSQPQTPSTTTPNTK